MRVVYVAVKNVVDKRRCKTFFRINPNNQITNALLFNHILNTVNQITVVALSGVSCTSIEAALVTAASSSFSAFFTDDSFFFVNDIQSKNAIGILFAFNQHGGLPFFNHFHIVQSQQYVFFFLGIARNSIFTIGFGNFFSVCHSYKR